MSEIIIKKNILITILPIIVVLFIFSVVIGDPLGIYYILLVDFSYENLTFLIVLTMLFSKGLSNLINIILFGMKAFVINDVGITYYKWKEKPIYWKDIKNIKSNFTDYYTNGYKLIIFMKNGKKKTISLTNTSIEFSKEEIYKFCLKNYIRRKI